MIFVAFKIRVTNFSALAVFEIYIVGLENEYLRAKMIYNVVEKIMPSAR